MKLPFTFLPFFLLLLWCGTSCTESAGDVAAVGTEAATTTDMLWIGTYTRKEGHVNGLAAGIYGMATAGDSLVEVSTKTGIVNPSYLCLSPNQRYLYAVSELGPDVDSTGYVYSYQVAGDSLVFLNRQPTFSFAPCYVSVHPSGKWLYVANYVGGVIVRYPLAADGTIATGQPLTLSGQGPSPRQDSSHPHSACVSPDGKWVMVADLGTDIVHTYAAEGPTWKEVSKVTLPAGSGPRHLVFHPQMPLAFVLGELSNTVTVFQYDAATGALNSTGAWSTLPDNHPETSLAADLHLTPDGKFLYASNRGLNSLASFRVETASGQLVPLRQTSTQGDFPRNFTIHPSGKYLLVANQNTSSVVRFDIDAATGALEYAELWMVKTPVCLVLGGG
jgi:6-phosphogluconolactonase